MSYRNMELSRADEKNVNKFTATMILFWWIPLPFIAGIVCNTCELTLIRNLLKKHNVDPQKESQIFWFYHMRNPFLWLGTYLPYIGIPCQYAEVKRLTQYTVYIIQKKGWSGNKSESLSDSVDILSNQASMEKSSAPTLAQPAYVHEGSNYGLSKPLSIWNVHKIKNPEYYGAFPVRTYIWLNVFSFLLWPLGIVLFLFNLNKSQARKTQGKTFLLSSIISFVLLMLLDIGVK